RAHAVATESLSTFRELFYQVRPHRVLTYIRKGSLRNALLGGSSSSDRPPSITGLLSGSAPPC
ncbi:unnamed protein product, partial [Amoebophrya sp. A25]